MSDLVFWIWWLDYVEVKSIDHVSKKKKNSIDYVFMLAGLVLVVFGAW